VRSRSALGDDGPFAGVRADFGVFAGRRDGREPGVRDTLADMGQTIAENFGGTILAWEELLE